MFNKIMISLVMLLPPCPSLYAWGGDGYVLPFRGRRVAARCADGVCSAEHGTWRAARQHRAVAAHGYGSAGHSGYGSAGQYGSTAGYGSAGQYGGYGSAGSSGYPAQEVAPSASVQVPVFDNGNSECNCTNPNCDCCERNKSSASEQDGFKSGLTSMSAFKSGLRHAMINDPGPLLASR